MFSKFFPSEMADSVYHIDYDKFLEMGIKGVIFDIDNTLATFDTPKPCPKVLELFGDLSKKGFSIGFLSNNKKERVETFCEDLPYPYIWRAKKPNLKGLNKLLSDLQLSEKNVILVGDQIFTDCWIGRRSGVYTILTKPIAVRDEWQVMFKRIPEWFVHKSYARKRGKNG